MSSIRPQPASNVPLEHIIQDMVIQPASRALQVLIVMLLDPPPAFLAIVVNTAVIQGQCNVLIVLLERSPSLMRPHLAVIVSQELSAQQLDRLSVLHV